MTAYCSDSRFLLHHTGLGHPESRERIQAIESALENLPLIRVQAEDAPVQWVETVHGKEYIQRLQAACLKAPSLFDSQDVVISEQSYEVARRAVGACLKLADIVMEGQAKTAFAAVRPPGHHAESGRAQGFCLFNNVAILARYLQQEHGIRKITILDWDVHHGNGTQAIFQGDPSIQYLSLHEYPHYPGTGAQDEMGVGNIVNVPMRAGAGDAEYKEVFENQLEGAIEGFQPDFLLLSAGFDAHHMDPLGNISLETQSFAWMTEKALQWGEGRLISVLEGGYNLQSLAASVKMHVQTLIRESK